MTVAGWIMNQLLHSDLLCCVYYSHSLAWKMQTKRMTELWKCSQLKQKLTGTKSKHTTAMLKLSWDLSTASMIWSTQRRVSCNISSPEATSNISRWYRSRYQAMPRLYYRETHVGHSCLISLTSDHKSINWCSKDDVTMATLLLS